MFFSRIAANLLAKRHTLTSQTQSPSTLPVTYMSTAAAATYPIIGIQDGRGPNGAVPVRYEILRFATEVHVVWEGQVVLPLNDLLICLVSRFRTEWWVADEAFEHDGAQRPPVAFVAVTLLVEDFWCDVVGCANGGVCLFPRMELRISTQSLIHQETKY